MSDRSRGLDAEVHIPHQAPFAIHAHLLAFNGRTTAGRTAIWVHAYAARLSPERATR